MIEPMTVNARSPAELGRVAAELLSFSGNEKVIAFYGELGAGKTSVIRELCHLIGVRENVSSPTFSIINEYSDSKDNPVYHFDFYRINDEKEAVDIGCAEYFYSGHLCLIEWPEKILNLLPHPHLKVTIEITDSTRRFSFSHDR